MPLSWPKIQRTVKGCLGIEMNQGQVWAVYLTERGVELSYIPQPDEQGFDGLLEWLKAKQFQEMPTVISMDVEEYELHLVESPPVAEEELSDALSFRIAEFVNDTAEGKLLQAFALPNDAYRGRMQMAYAAITSRTYIEKLVSFSNEAGLKLQQISINELSTLNVIANMESQICIALLRLEARSGVVYLYRDGALYFTRKISLGIDDLDVDKPSSATGDGALSIQMNSRLDVLALELQRSLDYFESQVGVGSVSQLLVLKPDYVDIVGALADIEDYLNINVRILSLEKQFNRQQEDIPLTASLAMALGGALGYELAG